MKKIILFILLILILLLSQSFAADIIKESKDIKYQGEKSLFVKIKFGVGKIEIKKSNSENLMEADFQFSSEDFRPVIEHEYDEKSNKSSDSFISGFWNYRCSKLLCSNRTYVNSNRAAI